MTQKIGIMGAGAVGCFVGGQAQLAGADVVFVGRARTKAAVAAHGLHIAQLDDPFANVPNARFETDAAALADCDTVLVTCKSGQTEEVAKAIAASAPHALVLSLQNGLRNKARLSAHMSAVVSVIVDFNVRSLGEGRYKQTTSGSLVAEKHARLKRFPVDIVQRDPLLPHQITKLLVNLNNAVSALSGEPTPALLKDKDYRTIMADLVDEGLAVVAAAGISPARFRGLPVKWMTKALRLPTFVVKRLLSAQLKVDPEARSSMWEDLSRGRPTEVDDLNGEIVAMAEKHRVPAPLNARITSLVKASEGAGSPQLSPGALRAALDAPSH